uniref:Uncharacterized protein n=1 Tax=Aegilops tauschii TaxID=37682 RepID=N1R447_AEGTA
MTTLPLFFASHTLPCAYYNSAVRNLIVDVRIQITTDFGRHLDYRKKLDVEQLANSVRSWSGLKYNVSTCKLVVHSVEGDLSKRILAVNG